MHAQQRAFGLFRKVYNDERPHEALDGKRPSDCYLASHTPLPDHPARLEYPFHYKLARVDKRGNVMWGRRRIYISSALAHSYVNFEPIDERCWEVYFGPVLLGIVDGTKQNSELIRPRRRWKKCQP